MNKYNLSTWLLGLYIGIFATACTSAVQSTEKEAKDSISTPVDSVSDSQRIADEPIQHELSKAETAVLIPRSYRDYMEGNDTDILDASWTDLYKKDRAFYLGSVSYQILSGFDECSEDSTKIIESNRNSIVFFKNKNIKLGKLNTAVVKDSVLNPMKNTDIVFNQMTYRLTASGKDDSSVIHNYELKIQVNGISQVLMKEKELRDTEVRILYAGDIDQDGKLDFVFSAPLDYEQERVLIFLSSTAASGKLLKLEGECAVNFDC